MASFRDPDWEVDDECCSPGVASATPANALSAIPVPAIDVCEDRQWAFVVGAPRCGTTSLSRYLADHPEICFSEPKESHYFALSDMGDLPDHELRQKIRGEYLARFFPTKREAPVMAEGSVTYL